MSKHDTWARLHSDAPLKSIEHLFPDGIPMRDPFPIVESGNLIWVVDIDRLSAKQASELALALAELYEVTVAEILVHDPVFMIEDEMVDIAWGDAENYRRCIEMADFMDKQPDYNLEEYQQFLKQQYRDWIEGDRVPEPMPKKYENVDPRLKSPATEYSYLLAEMQESTVDFVKQAFEQRDSSKLARMINHLKRNTFIQSPLYYIFD